MSYHIIDYTDKYHGLMQFNKNKDKYIHQWYSFVEGYSKDFINSVLDELDFTPTLCLEPFSGSGTTPLELQKKKIPCISFEVNPFMYKLAKVKMDTTYTIDQLKETIHLIEASIQSDELNIINPPLYKSIVENNSIQKWIFNKDIFDQIQKIRSSFCHIKEENYKALFEIILASLLLKYSNVYRNGKCLSYKKNWHFLNLKPQNLVDDFFEKLKNVVYMDIDKLNQCAQKDLLSSNSSSCIFGDVRQKIVQVPNNSVDLIITSPPYLNSRDYTDIYMVELWMLNLVNNYDELKQLRNNTLRSHVQVTYTDLKPLNIPLLTNTLAELSKYKSSFWNKNLLNMIIGYFEDMNSLFAQLHNKLTSRGRIYFNVAASAYHGVKIDVDKIIAEIAILNGFTVEEIRVARYLKSSGQQKNQIDRLRESVLVLKK